MAFAQLIYRESLREIEACLNTQSNKLYHMGIRARIARGTLAEANEKRDWRIYADFAQALIQVARRLHADEALSVELDNTVYALDATTVDLCLSVFPWAHFRQTKAAVKLHTLLDLLLPDPGAFYVMDRGYTDFERLYQLHQASGFFVIRAKSNLQFRRLYSRSVDKNTGLRCDQTVAFTGFHTAQYYPDRLRRIKYYDAETDKQLVFLSNNFSIPALTIAELYRYRWQVELFFKWIKQHLRIKSFFGISENAVKTQVWIAVSVYVLVAIIKKRLNIQASLYTILQILSLSVFEKIPLEQLLENSDYTADSADDDNQLNLF